MNDPIRAKAIRQYWAGVHKWATGQGLTKDEAHARLKEQLNFKHLSEIPVNELVKMAYQIGVIADGGPGE